MKFSVELLSSYAAFAFESCSFKVLPVSEVLGPSQQSLISILRLENELMFIKVYLLKAYIEMFKNKLENKEIYGIETGYTG